MSNRIAKLAVSISCAFLGVTSQAATNPGSPKMPFAFVENRGQADIRFRYVGSGPEFKAWFEDAGMILQQGQTAVAVAFEDAAAPRITATHPIGARASYLHGNDPAHWQTGLPLFAAIRYEGLWPGIDVTYLAEQSRAKAEYLVAAGADTSRIRLKL